jgi:hypothetical protein
VEEYIAPLILLVVLFIAFGLVHRNGKGGAGCSGCTTCEDKSECRNKNAEADAASPR